MEHNIKIKIADRSYRQQIHSEEEEENIRLAAASVSDLIRQLRERYPEVSAIDILTIAALNEAIEKEELKKSISSNEAGFEKLSRDLQTYVDSLK